MTFSKITMAAMFVACTVGSVSWAQEPQAKKQQTPEQAQKAMDNFFSSVAPAQAKAAEATLDLLTTYAERPVVADRVAAYKKNLFDALKKRGFTTEQALQITLATPLPSLH